MINLVTPQPPSQPLTLSRGPLDGEGLCRSHQPLTRTRSSPCPPPQPMAPIPKPVSPSGDSSSSFSPQQPEGCENIIWIRSQGDVTGLVSHLPGDSTTLSECWWIEREGARVPKHQMWSGLLSQANARTRPPEAVRWGWMGIRVL